MSQTIEIKVPDIGNYHDVDVIEVLVQPGQQIAKDSALLTLETDKATMDVPSSHAGLVKEVRVKVGGKVNQGDVVCLLEVSTEAGVSPAAAAPAPATPAAVPAPAPMVAPPAPPAAAPSSSAPAKVDEAGFRTAHASPSVRKFARELGVDLGAVSGSGPKGRITQSDVQAFVKAALGGLSSRPAGQYQSGTGLDLPEQLREVPASFTGYVWVEDIWTLGPALRPALNKRNPVEEAETAAAIATRKAARD